MKHNHLASKVFLLALSASVLSACGASAPEDLLTQTKKAIVATESGRLDMTATIKGRGGESEMDVLADAMLAFSRPSAGESRLFEATVDLSGAIKGAERDLDLDLNFDWISGAARAYLKVNDFASNDETLQLYAPLINMYKGKWIYLSEGFLPAELALLPSEGEDEVSRQRRQDLLVESTLFNVVEDNGMKKVDGVEVYHVELEPNATGLMDYYRGVAAINEVVLSDAELQDLVASVQRIERFDLYVGVDDFKVYKAEVLFKNELEDDQSTTFEFLLTLEASDYDQDISIEVPEGAEEFNPFTIPAAVSPALDEAPVVEESQESEASEASVEVSGEDQDGETSN